MLSFGYVFSLVAFVAYSSVVALIFWLVLTWNVVKAYVRHLIRILGALSLFGLALTV